MLRRRLLSSGTSAIHASFSGGLVSTAPVGFGRGVWNLGADGVGVWAHCWVLRDQAPALFGGPGGWLLMLSGQARPRRVGVVGVVIRLLFENYTVDASIFVVMTSY